MSDRYEIVRHLAKGAYGSVNLAIDKQFGQLVAVKSIRITNKQEALPPKAIFREIESLRQLSGSFVTVLMDVFPSGSHVCLVLEYLQSDLTEVISQASSTIPIGMLKTMTFMVLSAINHCHSNHIIHRDIKPSSK
jgi:serine/threonine protein kinase